MVVYRGRLVEGLELRGLGFRFKALGFRVTSPVS